jgi:hypothetical protein
METLLIALLVYLVTGGVAYAATAESVARGEDVWKLLAGLAITGAVLGLGKLLASSEKLTARLIIGRAIVSGGLAVGAGSLLAFIDGLHVIALCGFAAVIAVLGEQFVERLINSYTKK